MYKLPMSSIAIVQLFDRCPSFGRKLINTSRALTFGLWRTAVGTLKEVADEPANPGEIYGAWKKPGCSLCFGFQSCLHCCNTKASLVFVALRRYSTYEKTSTQILSKLFSQTFAELNDEESRKRRKREEEEEMKEMERAV
ncbi:hypothetical protein M5D96_007883 [Drosophila gunungcola]|uniref:Uncharacterized protein n=1 Tax=Drosophila gunungcola TaxID=103775 RepID=A0A9P9YLN0_9MUSC|nr:hypothetical protein M5D96_007883 [Drosophila gunungcola]